MVFPAKSDPYPHQHLVHTFDDQQEAWTFARVLAALLVKAQLTPEYGVRTVASMTSGSQRQQFTVHIGGPGPIPDSMQKTIKRQIKMLSPKDRRQVEVVFNGA